MTDEPKKLTLNDPIDPETLNKIGELTGRRYDAAEALLDLEQRKVTILVAVKGLDDEKQRLFNKILLERGLAPGTPVEIDGQTGMITVLGANGEPAPKA